MGGIKCSGLKTEDVVIFAYPCRLWGYIMIADGTNAGTTVLHDNASAASGTVVGQSTLPASTVASKEVMFGKGVACSNGLYLNLTTCTGVIVYYEPGVKNV